MNGQDFQDKLGAIVNDLQTVGRGRTVEILFRDQMNTSLILPLSSTAAGVVDAAQLDQVQKFLRHKRITTTQIYAETSLGNLASSYKKAFER